MSDQDEFAVSYITHTPNAILIEDLGNEQWIPRSQIDEDYSDQFLSYLERGDEIDITIPRWLAREKELI